MDYIENKQMPLPKDCFPVVLTVLAGLHSDSLISFINVNIDIIDDTIFP